MFALTMYRFVNSVGGSNALLYVFVVAIQIVRRSFQLERHIHAAIALNIVCQGDNEMDPK